MKYSLRELEIRSAIEMPAGIGDLFYFKLCNAKHFKIAKQSFQDALCASFHQKTRSSRSAFFHAFSSGEGGPPLAVDEETASPKMGVQFFLFLIARSMRVERMVMP